MFPLLFIIAGFLPDIKPLSPAVKDFAYIDNCFTHILLKFSLLKRIFLFEYCFSFILHLVMPFDIITTIFLLEYKPLEDKYLLLFSLVVG